MPKDNIMPFRVCYYHVVWATYQRKPYITPQIEPVILHTVKQRSAELHSPILAINTTADHIHIAVSISLAVAVADWVKQVKGLSAYEVNHTFPTLESLFRWQNGYGILTFGAKNLPFVIHYIEQQKEHHAHQSFESYLERMDED
jgi:REP element-mobilizing transposase RayT